MGKAAAALVVGIGIAVAGCGGGGPTTAAPVAPVHAPATIDLSSPAFPHGGRIPASYTCEGRDVSPPLRWSRPPSGTKELALLMIDLDAPGGSFTQWALAGVPPTTRDLGAGQVPPGAVAGRNGFGKTGYGGPCPPGGKPHHYLIDLIALPRRPRVSPGFASAALARSRPVGTGYLLGTYSRR